MQELTLVLVAVTLLAALGMPLLVYVKLRRDQQAEAEKLMARLDESLGASVKLLEVRNYYGQMSGEFKRMLDEAYKEGNRFRQDNVRKLIERLEQLKARTLDKTVKMLEQPAAGDQGQNRRRHRGGRRFHGRGRPQGESRGDSQGPSQPRPPAPPPPPQAQG